MSIIKELQSDVVSVNDILREKVYSMDCIELLRNCHPTNRPDYARTLHREKLISEEQMKEFTLTTQKK